MDRLSALDSWLSRNRGSQSLKPGAELRQFLAHCVCDPPSPLRAPADLYCGRKKLPFAEYSVVKELSFRSCELSAFQLPAVGAPRRGELLSNLCWIRPGTLSFNRPPSILRPAISGIKQGRFTICCGPPSRYGGQPHDSLRWWPANRSSFSDTAGRLRQGLRRANLRLQAMSEGWRIPGSNR